MNTFTRGGSLNHISSMRLNCRLSYCYNIENNKHKYEGLTTFPLTQVDKTQLIEHLTRVMNSQIGLIVVISIINFKVRGKGAEKK